jgi:hypothetical protein
VPNKVTAETPVPEWVKADPRIKLCAGTCKRYTRNTSMPLADWPGTVVRNYEEKCQKCYNDERRSSVVVTEKAKDNLQHTIAGLQSWNARRSERLRRHA